MTLSLTDDVRRPTTPDLKSLVNAAAETVLTELIALCHSSRQTLEDALCEVRLETRNLLFPMIDRREDAATRLTGVLGQLTGRHHTRIEPAEDARRARTRSKMQWHRGDDGTVCGDLYEYESETSRKVEVLLEDAVLPLAVRELADRLLVTLVRDCAALELLACTARPDDSRLAATAASRVTNDLARTATHTHDLNTTAALLEAHPVAPERPTVELS